MRWFNTNLEGRPPLPKAVLVALATLLVMEFGLARQEWLWTQFGGGGLNAIQSRIDAIVTPSPDPLVVVTGSSRLRIGASPLQIEQALGVPAGSVLNLAVAAGTPFDALTEYRLGRDKLRSATLLVIGLDDFYTNASWGVTLCDRRYATLDERLHDYDPPQVRTLLIGWLWRTCDAQRALQRFLARGGRPMPYHAELEPDRRCRLAEGWDKPATPADEPKLVETLEAFYQNWRPGSGRLRQLRKLAALARSDGLKVLVVCTPLAPRYRQLVHERYPEAEAYFGRCLEQLRAEGLEVLDWRDSTAVGWPPAAFHDYGHPTPLGVTLLSRMLADAAARACPELRRGVTPDPAFRLPAMGPAPADDESDAQ
ncbi:MAG: hypothetical protein HYU66_21815 [Armatimonadetes bacterium]|nr:hypothetical protein [Armatimonadota bacterium]